MEKLLNSQEVADVLGVQVCTIYEMTSQRRIPHIKIGGGRKLGFRPKAIEKWLKAQEQQPVGLTRR